MARYIFSTLISCNVSSIDFKSIKIETSGETTVNNCFLLTDILVDIPVSVTVNC